jgi:hypothetical protein
MRDYYTNFTRYASLWKRYRKRLVMDKVNLVLSFLATLAMLIVILPSAIRMNKGKMLRNTALWLLIAVLGALLYRTVGPGKHDHLIPQKLSNETEETMPEPPEEIILDQDYSPVKEM